MSTRDAARAAGAAIAAKVFGWWLIVPAALLLILALLSGTILIIGGGAASSSNALLAQQCGQSRLRASAPSGFTGSEDVTQERIAVVKAIDEGVRELGYGGNATRLIALAAFGESSLINIAFGDWETSGNTNPDGTRTTSVGILQQQDFWGTVEERMDPKTATQRFITGPNDQGGGLADVVGWESMEPTLAINAVQGNRDPYHYGKPGAQEFTDQILALAGIDVDRPATGAAANAASAPPAPDATTTTNNGPTQTGPQGIGCQKVSLAGVLTPAGEVLPGEPGGAGHGTDTYPFPASVIPPYRVYVEDGAGFYYGECTSYVMWKLAELYGATGPDPENWLIGNTKGGNGARLGNGTDWRAGWEARGWQVTTTPTAGSVAWYPAYSGGTDAYGHVAWVDEVRDDGTFLISEYNNTALAPPGHKYASRQPMTADSAGAPAAFLVPPPADRL